MFGSKFETTFEISPQTAIGLKTGFIHPVNVILASISHKNGRIWSLRTKHEFWGEKRLIFNAASGQKLINILQAVASNGLPNNEFAILRSIQQFRVVCLHIPGIESVEHREKVQNSLRPKIQRVKAALRVIQKGIGALKAKGKPWLLLSSYYFETEILGRFTPQIPLLSLRIIKRTWVQSPTFDSFHKYLSCTTTPNNIEHYLAFLARKSWDEDEFSKWREDSDNEDTCESFKEWQRSQYNPKDPIPIPLWLQIELYQHYNVKPSDGRRITFSAWKQRYIQKQRQQLLELPEKSAGVIDFDTLDDHLLRKLSYLQFKYKELSGSSMDETLWIARELWLETNPKEMNSSAFANYVCSQKVKYSHRKIFKKEEARLQSILEKVNFQIAHCKSGSGGRTKKIGLNVRKYVVEEQLIKLRESYEERVERSFIELILRTYSSMVRQWEASRLDLSFLEWRQQQCYWPYEPSIFVRLDAHQRKVYQTDCKGGVLYRNEEFLASTFEHTDYSGNGTMIFVLGPDVELYCGSHITKQFQHSSFFSDGVVMYAGEIKTDPYGKIVALSAKSGHYKPDHLENVKMLQWFQEHGVELSEVTFSYFIGDEEETEPVNALDYLKTFSHLAR